jgi:hypothetical protein
MRSDALHRLRSLWPVWITALAFLGGLAWDGLGGGVLAATLSFLVVGPAYLARRWWLGRTGRIPPPEPRTPAEQARLLRLFALVNAGAALGLLVAATRSDWLPGGGWNALAVLAAVCGLGSTSYVLAVASEVETGRADLRLLRVAAVSDFAVAAGLLAFAAANLRAGWLDARWTAGLAALGLLVLLGGLGLLARVRYLSRSTE